MASTPAHDQEIFVAPDHTQLPESDDSVIEPPEGIFAVPDHTQLPESDGSIVQNFQEHPQSMLLTDSITPLLQQRHPDGQYCIGQDTGIYWNLSAAVSDSPLRGAVAPDWFYIPNVPPLLEGNYRRSYVLWREFIGPLIVIEFVSGNGSEERDRTPLTGKFWIYEMVIRPIFYAIYEVRHARVDVYHLVDGVYQLLPPDEQGRYPIAPLGVALGIWQGVYQNMDLPWLRWWDAAGHLLLTGDEREQQTRQQLEQEQQRAQQAEERAERLAARLRALGIDPDQAE